METRENEECPPPPFYEDFCDLLSYASAHGPGFRVDARSIEIVRDPASFYSQLVTRIRSAEKRIMLSSLYLGAEPQAMELIEVLDNVLKENEELEVVILLDCLRGSRNTVSEKTKDLAGPEGTALAGVLSSVSLLYPLQLKYGDRFKAYYYHTPKLYGFWKAVLPERINELIGVQHTKCYMVDNDVLISGANLSEQYFTNRQDRYIWIRNNDEVATFFKNLLSTICDFSFTVDSTTGSLTYPPHMPNPTINPSLFNTTIRERFEALLQQNPPSSPQHHEMIPSGSELLQNADTWVFPTIQLGHANVRHDERFTRFILSHHPHHANDYTTFMTSPYFNIARPYSDAIKSIEKPFRVIVASPSANGFYNGSGLSGMVPWAYDTVLREWITNLPYTADVKVYEYEKEGWTFHAKGLWIEMSDDSSSREVSSSSSDQASSSSAQMSATLDRHHPLGIFSPVNLGSHQHNNSFMPPQTASQQWPERCSFTLVGSSNFGIRSMKRDLEAQLAIFTTNEDLVERLKAEREYVFNGSALVTEESFQGREENHSTGLKLVIPIATRYM